MAAADNIHSPTPEEIMEYIDGEGTLAARATIEAHLAACGACQALALDQRRLSSGVASWNVDPAPASLRAPDAPAQRSGLLRFPAWKPSRLSLGLAAAAAGLVLAVSLLTPGLYRARHLPSPGAPITTYVGGSPAPYGGLGSGDTVPGAPDPVTAAAAAPKEIPPAPRTASPPDATSQGQMAATGLGQVMRQGIIRTATLSIVVKDLDGVRQTVEGLVASARGFVDQMTVTGDAGSARSIRGTLRIPSDGLAQVADRLRQLGQVVEDTQGVEDVADQLVDLDARLASGRATERRLIELLQNRTGKLADVLEVEQELARVRLDIERLSAQSTNLGRRVSYATVNIRIAEERKAGLETGPLSLASRLRIAAADGLASAFESMATALLIVLRAGPIIVIWGSLLGLTWLGLRPRRL